MKNCPKCKEDKPLVNFDQHLNRIETSQGWCRMCREYHYGPYNHSDTIDSEPVKALLKTMRAFDEKRFKARMAKVFSPKKQPEGLPMPYRLQKLYGPNATDMQHWRVGESEATEQERQRARQSIKDMQATREEMDRKYVQKRMDLGVYDYEPYTEYTRPTPIYRPHHFKKGGLAAKARQIVKEQRYNQNVDPQKERAALMKKHGLTFFEAIKRWPLTEYGRWK